MKRPFALAALMVSVSTVVLAQTAPFDMSPERPSIPQAPRQSPPQAPAAPTVPAVPSPTQPAVPPVAPTLPSVVSPAPVFPVPAAPPAGTPSPVATPVSPPTPVGGNPVTAANPANESRRYILPFADLSLSGEIDQRQWTIYLTPEQAQTATALNIGYQNAIVVAPESSNLEAAINNVQLERKSISSPDTEGSTSIAIPPGTLQPGANVISLGVQQRHRTDCTIESTYDLWTDINPASTYLSLDSAVGTRFVNIEDIQATGADASGLTTIDIVAPGLASPLMAEPLLKLAQALALRTQMPNQQIVFHTTLPQQRNAGSLLVLAGTSREIASVTRTVPPEVLSGAYTGFEGGIIGGLTPLVVGGPTPQAVEAAIDSLSASIERPAGTSRAALTTRSWHTPDAPLIMSDRRMALSTLGVKSAEFAGRRFRTEFSIGMPADFYAAAYGEAKLLLDAAYTGDVIPGSNIDIYVNGNIASTVPISNRGGGIFRHLPINVTMRHFVPGVNTVVIEAVLKTDADTACLPGATANQTPRFALFDTSELHVPDFAMISRAPDLAATNGVAQPYRASEQPVAVSLERTDADMMTSAATLLARLAVAAGHPIKVDMVASPAAVGDRNALFIGTLSQMPPALVAQFNVAAANQTAWNDRQGQAAAGEQTNQMFEDWRQKVDGGVWQGQISSFEEWMRRNFDISSDTLRFLPGSEQVFTPSPNVSFMLAQGLSPGGTGVWTMATAPTASDLRDGMIAMAQQKRWTTLSGRIVTYDASTDKIERIAAEQQRFFVTRPFTFANWRLIAANWLSNNTLSYSLVFIGFLSLLGLATFTMLKGIGRKK